MSLASRITNAGIAVEAARIMSHPEKFCVGTWARSENGKVTAPLSDQAEVSLDEDPQPIIDAQHWVEANSPQAQQFCIEGAIMRAAPSPEFGREVINGLNEVVKPDGYSSAQGLNDDNYTDPDANRARLVNHLLSYAAEQLDVLDTGNEACEIPPELEKLFVLPAEQESESASTCSCGDPTCTYDADNVDDADNSGQSDLGSPSYSIGD